MTHGNRLNYRLYLYIEEGVFDDKGKPGVIQGRKVKGSLKDKDSLTAESVNKTLKLALACPF